MTWSCGSLIAADPSLRCTSPFCSEPADAYFHRLPGISRLLGWSGLIRFWQCSWYKIRNGSSHRTEVWNFVLKDRRERVDHGSYGVGYCHQWPADQSLWGTKERAIWIANGQAGSSRSSDVWIISLTSLTRAMTNGPAPAIDIMVSRQARPFHTVVHRLFICRSRHLLCADAAVFILPPTVAETGVLFSGHPLDLLSFCPFVSIACAITWRGVQIWSEQN